MNDQEILNRIREAIACLDEAALDLPLKTPDQRRLHSRVQDASTGLVEVREELSVRKQVHDNAMKKLKEMSR